jgi:hypothetical protein
MKDAKGHGSEAHGGPSNQAAVQDMFHALRPPPPAAHQAGVNKIGKLAKLGAALYVAQAAAGAAAGVGWALWHTFGGG